MKIFNYEFTKQNSDDFVLTFIKFIAPSGIVGIVLSSQFVDTATAAKLSAVIAVVNSILYALHLLLKPVTETGTLPSTDIVNQ